MPRHARRACELFKVEFERRGRRRPRDCRFSTPLNLRAIRQRCQARMISARTMRATSANARRPRRWVSCEGISATNNARVWTQFVQSSITRSVVRDATHKLSPIWTMKRPSRLRDCLKNKWGPVFAEKALWRGATREHTRQRSVTEEQRSQRAFSAKTLRATGLLREAFVGSTVTARCGDAPVSPPRPRRIGIIRHHYFRNACQTIQAPMAPQTNPSMTATGHRLVLRTACK